MSFLVYIKNQQNPLLYKHPIQVKATSNQDIYRRNYLQEFIKSQQNINGELKNASIKINSLLYETKLEQKQQYTHLSKQLEDHEKRTTPLIDHINKQDEAYKMFLQKFKAIDTFNQEILKRYEEEELVNQAIIDQLTHQDTAMHQLSKKIDQFENHQTNLSSQLDSQTDINDQILKTIEIQESFHKTILERIDQQEAINLKTSRELDNLKATIFERISYIVDKIEENYRHITGYVGQLFTKTQTMKIKQPTTETKEKEKTLTK